MRVLAARFADRRIASAMRDVLHRRMNLAPVDVDIAPLATAEVRASDDTVLAARCPDQDCAEAAALLRKAGGVILANVDVRWTLPRATATAHAWGSTLKRDRLHQ